MPIFTRDGGRFGLHIGAGEPPDERPRVQIRDPDFAPVERGPVAERVPDHVEAILDRVGVGDVVAGAMGNGQTGRGVRGGGRQSDDGGSAVRHTPRDIGAGAADGMGIDIWDWQARKEAARQTGREPMEIGFSRRYRGPGRAQRSHVEYYGATRNHKKK